jgi:hypothetical protein
MLRKKLDVDVIKDVLNAAAEVFPHSNFIKSLAQQYETRGGLSKKQLEGLYNKIANVKSIPAHKLATIEAVIRKKPTRYKSPLPQPKPLYTKDKEIGYLIDAILAKYPQHKRVLFLQSKFDNNEVLSPAEVSELKKFSKLLGS